MASALVYFFQRYFALIAVIMLWLFPCVSLPKVRRLVRTEGPAEEGRRFLLQSRWVWPAAILSIAFTWATKGIWQLPLKSALFFDEWFILVILLAWGNIDLLAECGGLTVATIAASKDLRALRAGGGALPVIAKTLSNSERVSAGWRRWGLKIVIAWLLLYLLAKRTAWWLGFWTLKP